MRSWILVCVAALLSPVSAWAQSTNEPLQQPPTQQEQSESQQLQALEEQSAQLRAALADRQVERQRLGQLVGELQQLRAQVAANHAIEVEREAERERQVRDTNEATQVLKQADAALSSGDADIGDALDTAGGLLTGPPLDYVNTARVALSNSDLSSAHFAIRSAINLASGGGRDARTLPDAELFYLYLVGGRRAM